METEDYESMHLERIFGVWCDEPFFRQPLTEENVRQSRKFRHYAEKKSTDGEELFNLLEDNDPTVHNFFGIEECSEEEFTATCTRIIKLMERTKVADCVIQDEENIKNSYDELCGNYDLESHFF